MPERLTADEVLRRYAAGNKDFTNANLRGVSFAKAVKRAKREGQVVNLSDADFGGAQIQGTNFAGVKLRGANFTGAKAGLRKRRVAIQWILTLLMSFIFSFVGILFPAYIVTAFFSSTESNTVSGSTTADYSIGLVVLLLQIYILWAFAQRGYTIAAVQSLLGALALAVVGATIAAGTGAGAGASVIAVAVAGSSAVIGAGAGAGAVASAGVGAGAVAVTVVVAITLVAAAAGATVGAVSAAFLFASFSGYVAWRALEGDTRFTVVRLFAVTFSSWNGTCFNQSDLTGTNFAKAILKSANFYQANLTRTCFRGAEKLTCARLSNSILQDWNVLHLLINGRSENKDFTGANLRGAYLAGADLTEANLTRADLSHATLENAELVKANLKESAVVGTNFTKAHLTGACLESWSIDSTTILKDVDCRFVFLLEQPNEFGDRERRPHNPRKVFDKGEFEQFFKEVLDEVQILIKNGIQPNAFRAAMQRLMTEHNITSEDITAYQRKGNDVQVSFKVPPGTDKGAVERTWDEGYEAGLAAATERIRLEQRRADDFKEVTLETIRNLGNITFNVTATSTSTAMTNSNNFNITTGDGSFINTGIMDGNTVNLGTISGTVTNAINQLPDQPTSDQPSLKDLLTELQAAIEAEPELSDDDKVEALHQVQVLAEAGQKPQDSALQKAAKTAMKILRGTTAGISETTKLAEAAAKLLPAIAAILVLL